MRVINMKPLLLVALGLILSINALPENIEDVKELPQAKEIQLEAEESEPQARSERCTDCSINFDANGEPLAAFKALPGAIVHTQEIIEECSSANGCAGLKIKDGRVIQKFGDLNAFNAASAADFANEFQFQAADIGGSGNVPFWWMNKDSPFKASGGGGFEKLSQASFTSSSVGSAGIRGAGLAGAGIGGAGLAGAGLGGAGLGGAGLGSAGLGVSGLGAAGIGNTAYGTSGIASTGLGGAGFGSTGLGATGLGAGGLGSTRLGGVGYGSAGVGATGLAADGLGSTRLGSAGYGSSGVGATGLGTGGLGSAGFGSAGIGATGIGSGGLGNTRLGGAAIGGNGFGGAAIGGAGVGAAGLGATRLGGVGIGTTGLATGSGTGAGLGYGANSGFAGAAGYGAGFSAGSALSGSSVNLAGNPFLNGGVSKYAGATTNLGVAGRPSSFPATSFESSIGSSVNLAKNPFLNGANIGQAQGGYNALSGSTNSQNFASTAGSKFSGLAGSGATAGANVNLIQTQQKVNEFDFDQQQQTQQNIGSFGIDGSSVGGGDLQQTCSGEGYACVIRSQCINGVVSGTGLLQASTKKQYCNLRTEICCRIQVVFNPQDTFSSGSDLSGVYRPVLKPGIPYLPPDNTNTGTNVVTSTLLPPRPIIVSTPRPFTSARPTYLPPVSSTSAPGYLPPIGEQTINRETIVPKPNYVDGSLILDQTRLPNRPKIPGPVVTEIPAGCAAALKCTPIEFCTSDGIISNTSIFLSQEQSAYRVPLTDCKDLATGRIGKCCRDPYYTDPWPTNQLGKWVPGVFGGNDGKYVPDSRGSGSGTPVVTARPFSTGGVILNDFIKPTTPIYQGTKGGSGQFSKGGSGQFTKGGKGQYGNAGQGQFVKQGQGAIIRPGQGVLVTPGGQGQVISQGIGTGVSQGFGQGVTNGGGTIIKEGGGQAIIPGIGTGISQGFGQGVASGGGAIIIPGEGQGILQGTGTGVSQGFGQGVVTGGGTIIREGEGQGILQGTGSSVSQGFGQGVITGGGTITKQGEGQGILQGTGSGVSQGFGQGVQTGEGQGVSQGFGQGVSQGFGQGVSQGLGQGVSQGFGQGFGQGISQGFGQGFSQGFGQGVAQGSGQGVSQGLGQGVTQGLGQGVIQGQGSLVSQGEGFGISQGFGQGVGQGEGSLVSQGGGLGVIEGQGGAVQQGFGQGVLQGQGSYVTTGQGQAISQGFGQGVSQGSGAYLSGGGGSLIRQGQGQAVSQGFGTGIRQSQGYTLAENEYSESRVQRVSLQPYKSGQQCGQLNSQRPFGNHNEQEVDFAEIPWQAMILEKTNKSLLCGGVITRPDVVITAAACVDGLDAQNVMIKGGEWKLGVDEEPLPFQIVQVKTIIVHPSYKPGTYHFDVAILVLSENLRFAKNIYPICLPSAQDDFEALYNGAGECIVTGWGKEILQSHLLGSIMHSLNVSLITPNECQAKINQDYPHLLEYYDQDSCVCGQPTNPLNNICSVDIGSALACTTGDGHYVLRGVYSWDSGCRQIGNQIGSFYKFDIEWYEWALGLIESVRFSQYTTGTIVTGGKGQFQIGGEGLAIKQGGGVITSQGQGFNIGSLFKPGTNTITYSEKITKTEPQIYSYTTKPEYITYTTKPEIITYTTKPKIISYTTKPEIITYTTKPEIVTYTTKPEYFTYTTKPKIVTYTTKPQIVTYTTKPKIVTYTTKPQFITYETSGSGTDPQYVAPGLSFKPSFSDILKPHKHSSTCQCEGKK